MTEHDVDIDPALEAHVRQTLAAIAATSYIIDNDSALVRSPRRWVMAAAALLIAVGAVATALAVRPAEEVPPAAAVPEPGWYAWIAPTLPDGFDHVAIIESNDGYVVFEAIDLTSSKLLNLTVSRQPIAPDPSGGSISLAELNDHVIEVAADLNVSLPDGRQIGVYCAVVSLADTPTCPALNRPIGPEDLSAVAAGLAMLPIDQLPPAEAAAPVVDHTSLAVSVANEVTGLGASGGNESTHFMMVQVGEIGDGDPALQIRAVAQYVPPIARSEVDSRSVVVNEVTITWRAMPDGSVWMVSSRPSVAAAAPDQILDLITSRLTDGPMPTYAPIPPTVPSN